jgi:hypothetical protein
MNWSWLTDYFELWWVAIKDFIAYVFSEVSEFIQWIAVEIVDAVLGGFAFLVESIPSPDFLSAGIAPYIDAIDPAITYFLVRSSVPEALGIIALGFGFRMSRKVLTLFQW